MCHFLRNGLSFLLYDLLFLVETEETMCHLGLSSTFNQTKKWQRLGWLLQLLLPVRKGACDVRNGWSWWCLNCLGEKKWLVVSEARKDKDTPWMIWGQWSITPRDVVNGRRKTKGSPKLRKALIPTWNIDELYLYYIWMNYNKVLGTYLYKF